MVQLTKTQCVLLRQHIKGDRLHLSSGFFRRLVLEVTNGTASSNEEGTESAVLQIQGGVSMQEKLCAEVQVTLCDGMHYYEDCFLSENLRDDLDKHGIQSYGEKFAVILVRRDGIHFQESSRKFFVRNYEFICMAEKIQGFQFCARRRLLLYTKNTIKESFLPITIVNETLKNENTTEAAGSLIEPPSPTPRRYLLSLSQRLLIPDEYVSSSFTKGTESGSPSMPLRCNLEEPPREVRPVAVVPPSHPQIRARELFPVGSVPSQVHTASSVELSLANLHVTGNPSSPPELAESAGQTAHRNADRSPQPAHQSSAQQSSPSAHPVVPPKSGSSNVNFQSSQRQSMYSCPPPPLSLPQNNFHPAFQRRYNQIPMPFPYQQIGPPPYHCMPFPLVPHPLLTPIHIPHPLLHAAPRCMPQQGRARNIQSSHRKVTIDRITPNTYNWCIVGKCTGRDDRLCETSAALKVFNFDLTDETGTPIRVVAYGQFAENLFSTVRLDCDYFLSNADADVRRADEKRFNTTGHAYQLRIKNIVNFQEADDVSVTIPHIELNVVPLNELADLIGKMVDILAIIKNIGLVRHANSNTDMREVELIDKTGTVVTLVMWNTQARQFNDDLEGQVLGIKGALVDDYRGRLSINAGSRMEVDPELPAVEDLLKWHDQVHSDIKFNKKHLMQIVPLDQLPQYSEQTVRVMAVVDKIGPIVQGGSYDVEMDAQNADVDDLKKWYRTRNLAQNTEGNPSQSKPQQNNQSGAILTLNVVPLSEVPRNSEKLIDILAVVDNVDPVIVNPLDNKTSMRKVQLVDESLAKVNLVLLGGRANNFSAVEGTVVGIRASAVKKDPLTGSFFLTAGKRLVLNPEVRGVEPLREWYSVIYLDQ